MGFEVLLFQFLRQFKVFDLEFSQKKLQKVTGFEAKFLGSFFLHGRYRI